MKIANYPSRTLPDVLNVFFKFKEALLCIIICALFNNTVVSRVPRYIKRESRRRYDGYRYGYV